MNIAKVVKILREEKQITQQTLANNAGLNQGFIGHIETGKRIPSVDSLSRIAKALDVPVDMLLKEPEVVSAINRDKLYIQERMDGLFEKMYEKVNNLGVR